MESGNIPKGTIRITLSNFAQYLIIALFYMIVTKTNALTQSDIGTLSILTFLASCFSLLTELALPAALTKFVSESLGKNQVEKASATRKTILTVITILTVASFLISALFSPIFSSYFLNNPDYLILIILNFGFASLTTIRTVYQSTLQALYLFGKMAIVSTTFILTSRVTAIAFALLNMGPMGVIIGYIAGSLISVILAFLFVRKKLPKPTMKIPLKPLISFSFPLLLSSLTTLILESADVVVISTLTSSLSLTGIYHIVVSSVSTLSIVYLSISTTVYPALSKHHGLEKPQNVSKILKITSRYLIFALFPACTTLAIVAPTALSFFYGASYLEGATALGILSITTIIVGLSTLFKTAFQAINKTGTILKINMIAATLSLISLTSFVPFFKLNGAAMARLVTQSIALIITLYMLKKEIKLSLDKESVWKCFVSTLVIIPFILIIEVFFKDSISLILTLVLEAIIALIIYLLCLYGLKALKPEDFQLLRQALPKFLLRFINVLEQIMVRP